MTDPLHDLAVLLECGVLQEIRGSYIPPMLGRQGQWVMRAVIYAAGRHYSWKASDPTSLEEAARKLVQKAER